MLFLRVLGLLPGGRSSRVHRLSRPQRESERTTDSRHPQRLSGGVVDPIERQFNAHKQEHRHVNRYPDAYKQMMQDPIYRHYVWKHQAKQGIGEEIDQALQAPCVLGDFSSSPTEEHPHITRPLPAIHQFKAMKPEKGR